MGSYKDPRPDLKASQSFKKKSMSKENISAIILALSQMCSKEQEMHKFLANVSNKVMKVGDPPGRNKRP